MDPLTVSTSVITIVSAIEEIRKSISRVHANRTRLQKLLDQVQRGLDDLSQFTDDRGRLTVSSLEQREALCNLQLTLINAHTCCRKLLPSAPSGRFRKIMVMYNAWARSGDIEDRLRELKEEVQACYLRFTAFSVARLDEPMMQIARSNQAILAISQHQQNTMDNVISSIRLSDSYPPHDLNDKTFKRLYPAACRAEIELLYIHHQVEAITDILHSHASRGGFVWPCNSLDVDTDLPVIDMTKDLASRRREVIAITIEVFDLIQGHPSTSPPSIQQGALKMIYLSYQLHGLQLHDGAVAIGTWTVKLYKALAETNAALYEPFLGVSYGILSLYHLYALDTEAAIRTTKELVERLYASRSLLVREVLHWLLFRPWSMDITRSVPKAEIRKFLRKVLAISASLQTENRQFFTKNSTIRSGLPALFRHAGLKPWLKHSYSALTHLNSQVQHLPPIGVAKTS